MGNKMKNKNTALSEKLQNPISKSYTDKIDTTNTQIIHDRWLSLFGTGSY
jgi:hypothetical protein